MVLAGTVTNGVVVLDPGTSLPEGTRVDIAVHKPTPRAASSLGAALLKHAGTAVDLPEDAAKQHDHYLYGTPKR